MMLHDRIARLTLQRAFHEGHIKITKVSGYKHIFRLEVESAPGSLHSQTAVWYEFEAEAEQFSEGFFHTVEECVGAYRTYTKFFL